MKTTFKVILFTYFAFFESLTFAQKKYFIEGSDKDKPFYLVKGKKKYLTKISRGSTYLFKRGQTFNFKIDYLFEKDDSNSFIKVGSYGLGAKPIFNFLARCKKGVFVKDSSNIWKIDLSDDTNFDILPFGQRFNVGYLSIDNKIYANLKSSKDSLNQDGDFYVDKHFLFVKSNFDLSSMLVEFSTNVNGIDLVDNLKISDIEIVGAGGHGMKGVNVKNVYISNVSINNVGGAILPGFGTGFVRYGNGIEFWNGALNCHVKRCIIKNVYDAAMTIQGNADNMSFDNVSFEKNVSQNNEQAFEFWSKGKNISFTNCRFEKNYCSNSGKGWSHTVRPDKKVGVHILNYSLDAEHNDILLKDNKFYESQNGLIYIDSYKKGIIFKASGNTVYNFDDSLVRLNSKIVKLDNVSDILKIKKGFKYKYR